MIRHQPDSYTYVDIDELLTTVGELKASGFRFVQLCAITLEDSCDVLYSFLTPSAEMGELLGLIVHVPDGAALPSITEFFPAAFVFENETHDLFGIDIYGINLDYHGEFYVTTGRYPMNPRAAAEEQQEHEEVSDNE